MVVMSVLKDVYAFQLKCIFIIFLKKDYIELYGICTYFNANFDSSMGFIVFAVKLFLFI